MTPYEKVKELYEKDKTCFNHNPHHKILGLNNPDSRDMAWVWQQDYNHHRPPNSLGKLPSAVYWDKLENSTYELSHDMGS